MLGKAELLAVCIFLFSLSVSSSAFAAASTTPDSTGLTNAASVQAGSGTAKAGEKGNAESAGSKALFLILTNTVNWQSLGLFILAGFIIGFRREISGLLTSGGLELELWGQKIKLRDAVAEVQKSADVTLDDLDELRTRLADLERKAGPVNRQVAAVDAPEFDLRRTKSILTEALNSKKYSWRTIRRLAGLAGLPEDEVVKILESEKVEFSEDRDGRKIVRLR